MTSQRARLLCIADMSDVPEAISALREVCDVETGQAVREEVARRIEGFDLLWVNFDFKVDKALLDKAPRLRAIVTATTGTDHLDKAEMARRGIALICIAKDFGLLKTFSATAECAWMLLLNCARNFRQANAGVQAGKWEQKPNMGRQLKGLTLGVLGVGRLGTMTVEFGKAFGMRVLGCDRTGFDIPGVERVDFETLLRESDALLIHIHMTSDNKHLFNAAVFAKMKPGCILVNTSRGDLIDEQALLAALESGRLGGFGADVLHDEWREDMSKQPVIAYAQTHGNVVITPHIGGTTGYTIKAAREFVARKVVHYLKTGEDLVWG
jgi:D-3-phosphoglycerate dehydrogenase / 2-oxoglutarate reductase